jgi:hypothetical protein
MDSPLKRFSRISTSGYDSKHSSPRKSLNRAIPVDGNDMTLETDITSLLNKVLFYKFSI